MPTKFNQPIKSILVNLQDGTSCEVSGIESIFLEPTDSGCYEYYEEPGKLLSSPMEFECHIKINVHNDRNHKSRRYRKNRKGCRGFWDLVR